MIEQKPIVGRYLELNTPPSLCSVASSRCVSLLLGRVHVHELGHVLLST